MEELFSLDHNFLNQVGLGGLPTTDRVELLEYIREVLNLRVGQIMADNLDPAILQQFMDYIDRGDQVTAIQYLASYLPNYLELIHAEVGSLKEEIKADAAGLMADYSRQENQSDLNSF